jgi:Trk K+ transport system NAD-binding subunit
MVPLTNNDQVNILSSVMAKRLGCRPIWLCSTIRPITT